VSAAQRALVLAIRGYRRWVSGRGPLRRVRCTFDHGDHGGGESCSAFGLRAALEAPGARVAWGRIRRRIHRCGETSLFALDAPDGTRALGWGADHDRPLDELHAELVADGERAAACAQVLSAREVAARWRGDLADVVAARARRGDLAPVRPPLRAMPRLALLARALGWRVLAATLVVAGAAIAIAPLAGAALAALALLPMAAITRRHLARRARLRRQARSAALRDDHLVASLPNRCMVAAISAPRLHSTMPKPSM
jgi:putative component of membrane protein insertase Oxa1/YidC/SpoIIIJ protein YidD